MPILLPLISQLQRHRFARTRSVLVGSRIGDKGPWLIYSAIPERKPSSRIWKSLTSALSILIIAGSLLVGSIFFVPSVYYRLFPSETIPVVPTSQGTPLGGNFEQGTVNAPTVYLPPQDESLPTGSWVIIPRIGVRTQLQKTTNPDEALSTGVWWVPDFGEPGDQEKPMILVAHRFGYKWWWQQGSEYWKYHSFYLLPELEPGDIVEVIVDQRKWQYEIYAGEEGEEITDYQADLILYTCKFLSSPVRYFRYARVIDPTVDTQHANLDHVYTQ